MTELQVKELELKNKQLRGEYDSLNELIACLRRAQLEANTEKLLKHQRLDGLRDLFYEIYKHDDEFLINTLIDKANQLIVNKQTELKNISLLSILSEIEKVQ